MAEIRKDYLPKPKISFKSNEDSTRWEPITTITLGVDGLTISNKQEKSIKDLPKRYIINRKVCVCNWNDGTMTKSWNHEDNEFDKEIGFLFCCFQHYYADFSKNKRTKILSWINYDKMKEFLLEVFKEKNNFTTIEAKKYLKDLNVEEPKKKETGEVAKVFRAMQEGNKENRKPKHMKEVTE